MRIVFTSNLYAPLMGGSVVVLDRLAREAAASGHEVVILTKTPGDGCQSLGEWRATPAAERVGKVLVCRFSDYKQCVAVLKQADRVIMIELSLNWLVAIFAAGKRPLATHHTHFVPMDGVMRPYRVLQYFAGLFIPASACSAMIARQWGPHVGVLPNPYDADVFQNQDTERDIDFLFVGRFGPEKGVQVMMDALRAVKEHQMSHGLPSPRFALAGKGPEEPLIREKIKDFGLEGSLVFLGLAEPRDLAHLYNRARVVVIPSIWQEPFGLISLEALACGCSVIASDQAGLKESTGGMARYYATGDAHALSQCMIDVMKENMERIPDSQRLATHLGKYTTSASLKAMLDLSSHWWNRRRC